MYSGRRICISILNINYCFPFTPSPSFNISTFIHFCNGTRGAILFREGEVNSEDHTYDLFPNVRDHSFNIYVEHRNLQL